MCHETLKTTEREVGQALEEVAKKSCDDVVAIEKESSGNKIKLTAINYYSYDIYKYNALVHF